jgi:hypothetical protein
LKFKNIHHQMLPEDIFTPGKFPEITLEKVEFVCLCYLAAPSEAKHSYLLRRLTGLVKEVRVIGVSWMGTIDNSHLQSPANAVSMLPQAERNPVLNNLP